MPLPPRSIALVVLSALVASCSGGEPEPEPVDLGPPTDTFPSFYGSVPSNVLMISIDTFRRDHMSRYDPDGNDNTPFLAAMAEAGVALDDHTTCSNWTFAGIGCTLYGADVETSGFTPQLTPIGDNIWPEATFLAGHLKEQFGMVTVASSTNGWFSEEWGLTQGYDVWFHPRNGSAWGAYREGRDALLSELDTQPEDTPWFLHVHMIEPHVPYTAPAKYDPSPTDLEPIPWDLTVKEDHYDVTRNTWPELDEDTRDLLEQHLRYQYRAELAYTDQQIQDALADADRRGLLDDTLVVVWTDHGEQFWEHGYQSHAYTLFREENDGVALFWAKNIVPQVWNGPTTSPDIAPTILSVLGGTVPEHMTGLPLGTAPDDRARFGFSVARLGGVQAVQKEGHKLTYSWASGGARYFDLNTDPDELVDRFDPEDPKVQELWQLLLPRVLLARPLAPAMPQAWPVGLPVE
jgi:arylsulfatase A-like enzyme